MTRATEGKIYFGIIIAMAAVTIISLVTAAAFGHKCVELQYETEYQYEIAEKFRNGQTAAWARVAELEQELERRNGGQK